MLGREENWFQRNRSFILGFAIAVVVLNIVFAVLLPSEKSVSFEGTPMEYAWRTKCLRRHAASVWTVR